MSGRILVVDDIATNRMILRSKLAASYYEVVQAENGLEALQKAVSEQPDLILLDILMPDIDGFEVCRRLKATAQTAHIPVIIVTSLDSSGDRLRGLECGADDFLTKPINDLALFSRVRNALRAKFMLDELRLRDRTSRDLGLGDLAADGAEFTPMACANVALVASTARMAKGWRDMVAGQPDMRLTICADEASVLEINRADLPDVFVIHSRPGPFGDGLRLVSHLRARPWSRHVPVILVVPEGDLATAGKGLDLGANDYVFDPVEPAELIVRLNGQIRRKQVSDQLRNNVTDTLDPFHNSRISGILAPIRTGGAAP